MDNEKIIEKIKKLLELTTSSNENEARHAMETAQKLMIKYSIDHNDLSNNESAKHEAIIQSEYWNKAFSRSGVLANMPQIISAIGPIFGVYSLSYVKHELPIRIDLLGFQTNIDIVRFALDSILIQGANELKIAYKQCEFKTSTFGDSFWKGFAQGLAAKFAPLKNNEQGLVVYNRVRERVKSLATSKYRGPNANELATQSGYEAGQRAELRRALTHTNTGKLLN